MAGRPNASRLALSLTRGNNDLGGEGSPGEERGEDRLSLAQMERLRAELRPNLVFVLELVRRELDELRVERELIRRELEDIQALLHDMTQRNAAGRLWWFAVALVVACCGACQRAHKSMS